MDMDFAVRGPLIQPMTASLSGFFSSGHGLALRFLQTLPHGSTFAVCLYFTSIRLYGVFSSPDGQSCLAHRPTSRNCVPPAGFEPAIWWLKTTRPRPLDDGGIDNIKNKISKIKKRIFVSSFVLLALA